MSFSLNNISGAAKAAAQIGLALIVYRNIYNTAGPALLGTWVLLLLWLGFGGLVNFGMGYLVIKDIAKDHGNTKTTFYAIISGFVVAIIYFIAVYGVILASNYFGHPIYSPCSTEVTFLIISASFIRLLGSLFGSVLCGLHKYYLFNISQMIQLILFTALYFTSRTEVSPLLNLADAYFWSAFAECAFCILVCAKIDIRYLLDFREIHLKDSLYFIKRWYGYGMMEVGLLGREPLLKITVSTVGGADAVGLLELASKIPSAIRNTFTMGLSAMMPAYVKLKSDNDEKAKKSLCQKAINYVLTTAVAFLILYALNSKLILTLWLGSSSASLVKMTILFSIWNVIVALNTPAWWIGASLESVWTNVKIVWLHLGLTAILLSLVLINQTPWTNIRILIAWIFLGLIMQSYLYYSIERASKDVYNTYVSKSTFKTVLQVFSFLILSALIQSQMPNSITGFISGAAIYLLALVISFFCNKNISKYFADIG